MGLNSQQPTRTERKKAKKRVRLLESAHRIMSVSGVDNASITKITTVAGVGFGTFFNYFDNKDDIAIQV